VTGPVAGEGGTGHRLPGSKPILGHARGLGPAKIFSNIQNQLKLVNSNPMPSRGSKLFKLCKMLALSIFNKFLNWVYFKFPMDHML
jgi:hypothetical protein